MSMTEKQRKDALKRGLSAPWQGEPMMGSYYGEEEFDAVIRAMRTSMDPAVGFGFICEEIEVFEKALAEYFDTKYAITINGAGGGLDMAMVALDLEPEDEVICPTINFRAAPMAVLGQRAKLVLCEADPQTLCADPNDVEKRLTPRTRCIFPTHMNGISAAMDDLLEIAERHPHPKHGPLKVIGDGARALGGGYKGTKIGKKGWMNVFSFHTMKNMTTLGEGGAITTDDDVVADRLREIRMFGEQHWGSNYKMTKMQAAVGPIQLGRLDGLIAARRKLAQQRNEMLEGCPELTLPYEPGGYVHSYYLYSILVSPQWAGEKRDRLMAILTDEYGVDCGVYNPPVHRTVPFIAKHTQGQELPISDEVAGRLFCVPMHPRMSEEDNEFIAAAIWDAAERTRRGG
jgi:perosamine synthetase